MDKERQVVKKLINNHHPGIGAFKNGYFQIQLFWYVFVIFFVCVETIIRFLTSHCQEK